MLIRPITTGPFWIDDERFNGKPHTKSIDYSVHAGAYLV